MEINSCVCRMKVFFNLNSQRNEKFELFSQGTYDFQNLGNETQFIANYENIKIFYFSVVCCKVMAKRRDLTYAQMIFDIRPNSFVQKCKHSTK